MATIRETQAAAWANKLTKGFNVTDVPYEFTLLTEEVGEAIGAWRKGGDLAGELADIVVFALSLAEMNGIDLEDALARKMAINAGRTYVRNPASGVLVKAVS